MKILTVVGARPQFIKAATISRQLAARPNVQEIIVHTGQHFDSNMSEVFFQEMEIPAPSYHLNIHSLPHGAMTGRMLEALEEVMLESRPDLVLVYGDTNSTLAGALAASKLHIKLAHVEAGLRSFNKRMPEEVNRILTDRLADYLYVPTAGAMDNLAAEGFASLNAELICTGDVMQDAAFYYAEKLKALPGSHEFSGPFALATVHRAENTDRHDRLEAIVKALNAIHKDVEVILPIHPRTKARLSQLNIKPEFKVLNPLGYFDMIRALKQSAMVITDSGGLQKEAYFFEKPCITLRDETEWIELVEGGFNVLAGADEERIKGAFRTMQSRALTFDQNLYGGGNASKLIAEHLLSLRT